MSNEARDTERRCWSDMVASAVLNYNILEARRGQELTELRFQLLDLLDVTNAEGVPADLKNKMSPVLSTVTDKLKAVVKDIYVHFHHGPETALQLRQDSSGYLSEAEQKTIKKMKKEKEESKKAENIKKNVMMAAEGLSGAKMMSACSRCGARGHWYRDSVCPLNKQMSQIYNNQPQMSTPSIPMKKN